MMLSGANVLILDEPTNHLDIETITSLNNGLIDFGGVVLFRTHDHEFIETTANRIIEFKEDGKYIDKMMKYSEYLEKKE
jgi:ATPase subunit of ABC transporter with duplicated ATPase domains